MGGLVSRVRRLFRGVAPETRVLIQGLDAAGKTSLLYRLKLGEVVTTIPTIGFNVESVHHGGVEMTVWDVGGRSMMRPLMKHYYQGTRAYVWVVDSTDRDRLDGDDYGTVRGELQFAFVDEQLRGVPMLFFANKQDLTNAMTPQEITERLGLAKVRGREWRMQGCSVLTGEGLAEGLQWLTEAIERNRKRIEAGQTIDDDDDTTETTKPVKTISTTDTGIESTTEESTKESVSV